jgi:hypothetical protein
MTTVKLEVSAETAKRFLADYEREISEKVQTRDQLAVEITKLETEAKAIRQQLNGVNGSENRQRYGQNKERIVEYLNAVPENKGARMVEIKRSTGISASSLSFTLAKHPDIFSKRGKVWKLVAPKELSEEAAKP